MKNVFLVDEFTNGVLDPKEAMIGRVEDGGYIVAATAPGCWGPMLTPELKGGHEVTKPVYVEGAEIGDSIAIYIKSIDVISEVTASGSDRAIEGRYEEDGFVVGKCPECGEKNPKTILEGIGPESVRCANCGARSAPFEIANGYTMAYDEDKKIGITLDKESAAKVAGKGRKYMSIPDKSIQNPVVNYMPHDIVGNISRLRPFIGQLGTTPSIAIPDSHNAGDFGSLLIGASHEYSLTQEELDEHRTDGHMDINKIREGSVVIAPVKVKGAGVYVGDVHAMQGEGEIAGHTCDVAALVTLRVEVIKNLSLEGPIVIPLEEDLPYLAKPIKKDEKRRAKNLSKKWKIEKLEKLAPISFVGTGGNLNIAIDNSLERGNKVLGLSVEEIKNRVTINGAVEIGRYPGTAIISFLAPIENLKDIGLYEIIKNQYNLK